MQNKPGKRYLTIKEAAEIIGVSTLTLRNWDKKGKFPASRHPINNYRAYHIEDIEKFLTKFDLKRPRKLRIKFIED